MSGRVAFIGKMTFDLVDLLSHRATAHNRPLSDELLET